MSMTEQQYRDTLMNAHLRTLKDAQNLKEIGYAKLIYVVLYLNEDITKEKLSQILAEQMLGVKKILSKSVEEAVNLLKINGLIIDKSNKWSLTIDAKKTFEKATSSAEENDVKILNTFFPKSIDQAKLKNWFLETSSEYFAIQAENLISSFIRRKEGKVFDIEEILKKTIKKYGFHAHEEALAQGYKEFLLSNEPLAEEKIWDFMQGLIATKLVVADISPDQLSLDRYRDTKAVLDTNILFAIELKDKNKINKSIQALSEAMKVLGITLYVTSWTKDEYFHVCREEKRKTVEIFEKFDLEIIKNTKGSFLKAALQTKCKSVEDIERLFGQISKIPEDFGAMRTEEIKKEITDEIKFEPKTDNKLFEQIGVAARKNHLSKIRETIVHDLLLTKYAIKQREKEKYFVLTLDRSMEELALSWVTDKEDPIWLNFLSLVQLLAINGVGPSFDSKNLAPLVKAFIEYQGYSKFQNYTKSDLLFLSNCTDRIKEIPLTKVINVLNKIHRRNIVSISPKEKKELTLQIQRELTISKEQVDTTIREQAVKIREKDSTIDGLKSQNYVLERKEYKIKQIGILIVRIIIYISISYALFILLGNSLVEQLKIKDTWGFVQIIAFVLAPIWSIVKAIQTLHKNLISFDSKRNI